MKINNTSKFLISLVIPQLAGIIGSVFTASSIPRWYSLSLVKPSFNPPSWIFGPVWTILFLMMGVALFLVWKRGVERKDVRIALYVFSVQIILNTLWSIIFFGFKNPGLAFIEIIFLWTSILLNIIVFSKVSKIASWLLVPYIAWVSFAGYLNYSIWILNS